MVRRRFRQPGAQFQCEHRQRLSDYGASMQENHIFRVRFHYRDQVTCELLTEPFTGLADGTTRGAMAYGPLNKTVGYCKFQFP